eukprot:m.62367 g.62367  ORF g.62367 m.62367 type:complete len:454 (-) comp15797_c0_seq2:1356-2717(-)
MTVSRTSRELVAVVVGCGPGGAMFARAMHALDRCQKWRVVVLERNDELPTFFPDALSGVNDRGLGIWPNASRALEHVGILKHVRSLRIPPACYRSSAGQVLSHCSKDKASFVRSMYRNELLNGLIRTNTDSHSHISVSFGTTVHMPGVEIHTDGFRAESTVHPLSVPVVRSFGTQDPSQASLQATSFSSLESAILMERIGADILVVAGGLDTVPRHKQHHGLVVNGLIRDVSSFDFAAPLVAKAGREPCTGSHAFLPYETLLGGRYGSRFAVVPLRDNGLFWFATLPGATVTTAQEESAAALKAMALAAVKDSHAPNAAVVAATDDGAVFAEPLCAAGPTAAIATHPRTVLLGDAAHALPHNLAQGASVAIEDGYALAAHLTRHGHHDAWDLAEYHARRAQRIAACANATRMTQLISDYPRLSAAAMAMVPAAVNTAVFDWWLDYSLGPALVL